MVQQPGCALTGRLDGRKPDVQGAPQPMPEDSQASRSETPHPHKDIWGSCQECKGIPSSLCPSDRTNREWALVGSRTSRQERWPPSSVQSTSQVRPGRAAPNPNGGINDGVRSHTNACDLRLQTTMINSEATKRMQQQTEGATQRPCVWHTDMPSGRHRSREQLDNRQYALSGARQRASGRNHYTGWYKHCQEWHAMLGKREESKCRGGSLHGVGRQVTLWWRPSGSSSSVHARYSMEDPRRSTGDWT